MSAVKLADIARKLDVSVATVSMVLSGKGNISSGLRERILRTAGDMGYTKRNRKTFSKSKCIAVLSYMNQEWAYLGKFIAPILAQIESVCLKNGYYPIIIPITDISSEDNIKETILQSHVSGVISIHAYYEHLFKELCRQGIPLVVVNNSFCQSKYHSVCVDDYQGASDATQLLINRGHKSILFMDYWRFNQPTVVTDRFAGFKTVLEQRNIPFNERKRITVNIREINELKISIKCALEEFPDTSAIFAHDDRLAIQIYTVLRDEGIVVPETISLICPGDTLDYSLPYIPPITTMRIDTNLLGNLAAEQIIKHITEVPQELVNIRVVQQLVDRGSCYDINHQI